MVPCVQSVIERVGWVDCVQRTWTCRLMAGPEALRRDVRAERERVGEAVVRWILSVACSVPGSQRSFTITMVSWSVGSMVWLSVEGVQVRSSAYCIFRRVLRCGEKAEKLD